jgi:hypothetical protein
MKANFSKFIAFEGTIRKFLNMAAVHFEGPRLPPYAYLKHLSTKHLPSYEPLPYLTIF